jgi:hypothetical protein
VTAPRESRLTGWRRSAWEYLVEVILASLLCWLLFRFVGQETLRIRLCALRSDLLLIFGVALAAAIAVWAIFVDILRGEFGAWLRKKGEARAYSTGLTAPVFVYLAGLLVLLFEECPKTLSALILTVFVLLYGLINFVTMIRNVNGLVGLWQTWQEHEKIQPK